MENNQPVRNVSNSTIVGANLHGNGNNIANYSSPEVMKYIDLLQNRDAQVSELIAIVKKLTSTNNDK